MQFGRRSLAGRKGRSRRDEDDALLPTHASSGVVRHIADVLCSIAAFLAISWHYSSTAKTVNGSSTWPGFLKPDHHSRLTTRQEKRLVRLELPPSATACRSLNMNNF